MQNYIKKHKFLGKMFPNEIFMENILLGDICMKISGDAMISLHIKDKPQIDVKKWGKWGRDYNIVVINLLLVGVSALCTESWDKIDWGFAKEYKEGDIKKISFTSGECVVNINYEDIIFQGCDRYLL